MEWVIDTMPKNKDKEIKTNMMRILDGWSVDYRYYTYECGEFIDALHTARSLNQPPEKLYKTLVTEGAPRQYYVFVIPIAMELDLKDIVGTLPDDQDTTPDIPQDLRDEYNQKMAEHGISTDDADYESLTEEQKDLEHQFFTEMWNEYFERYPEAIEGNNRYNSWTLKGDWKFNVDVEKNTSDTVKKDVNVVDENGDGVLSITKTPFEITMKMQDPEAKYFAVMLDANGDIMPYGGVSNSNNTYAIQDRDISTVYIYLCDYYEYMDELKGYYWSDDYEEKAKTRTFKQLLDERAVAGTEVHFDTDK